MMIKLYNLLFEAKEKPEPDEPDGGVLDQYVFGSIRKDIGQNIDEPDTDLEKRIYNALVFYTSFNSKSGLNNVAEEMFAISRSGKYKKYFSVPDATAWRLLLNISKGDLEKIIGKEVEKDEGVEDRGTISPRSDSTYTGWSLNPQAMIKLYSQAKSDEILSVKRSQRSTEEEEDEMPYMPDQYLAKPRTLSENTEVEKYVVLAKCNTSGNPFFFNIDAALEYLSIGGSKYSYQKEVLAYGDVIASGVSYINVKRVTGNPVPSLLAVLK